MPQERARLPDDLVDLIESGASQLIGTADADHRAEGVRAVGALVAADREHVTLFVPEATGARTRANIERGSLVAATFCRVRDLRTIQIKGRAPGTRPLSASERAASERYLAAFTEALYGIGISRGVTRRLRIWPAFALELEIASVYNQTPGPTAGERMPVG